MGYITLLLANQIAHIFGLTIIKCNPTTINKLIILFFEILHILVFLLKEFDVLKLCLSNRPFLTKLVTWQQSCPSLWLEERIAERIFILYQLNFFG